MKIGTWNVRGLYRAGSLKAAARELEGYKLDVSGVQEVRWDKGGTVTAGDCDFFYGKGFVLLTQHRAGDKIKNNEMGWSCCAYG
jgi:exonuclease III